MDIERSKRGDMGKGWSMEENIPDDETGPRR